MKYWLIKSEPEVYHWQTLVAEGGTFWDGVRNYQARIYLREMQPGDLCLFYHSADEKRVMGIAEVTKAAYQDPTTTEEWVAVDVKPVSAFKRPITLKEIKAVEALSQMILVRNSRLSVSSCTPDEFNLIVKMGNE